MTNSARSERWRKDWGGVPIHRDGTPGHRSIKTMSPRKRAAALRLQNLSFRSAAARSAGWIMVCDTSRGSRPGLYAVVRYAHCWSVVSYPGLNAWDREKRKDENWTTTQ